MINLREVEKKYGNVAAVAAISFQILPGEKVVIVGPSGSGKTTLLRLIAGLECPDTGEIYLDGNKASGSKTIYLRPDRRGVGMIFQDLALWPHMTVKKNIEFGLESKKIPKKEIKEKIEKIAEQTQIAALLSRYPHTLSGGEKQKVALARTLVLEPKILLLDEPLTSLDAVLKDSMMSMISQLCENMCITSVYVSHYREEAHFMANKVIVLEQGHIVQIGAVQELQKRPRTEFVRRFFRQ